MEVSTQVLDAAHGRPASDVMVRLEFGRCGTWQVVGYARTDRSGRIDKWGTALLEHGHYRLTVDAGGFYATLGLRSAQTEVSVTFFARPEGDGYHVPVLLSPFGFMTCTSEEP